MGAKMNDAPVYFTIAQAQYNMLPSLDAYLQGIGDAMRQAGFADYKISPVLQVHIEISPPGAEPAQPPRPPAQQVLRYIFSDMSGTSGFVLLPNALSYYTTAYETFDPFSAIFLQGLRAVHEAVGGLSFIDRLSLRYLDAVVPKDGEVVNSYLAPELHGLPVRMPESMFLHSMTQALRIQPDVGNFLCRSMVQNGPVGLPPELVIEGLTLPQKLVGFAGPHAVLDTDGSYVQREVFDLAKIAIRLRSLHDGIDQVFRASVTDHALHMWKEGNL